MKSITIGKGRRIFTTNKTFKSMPHLNIEDLIDLNDGQIYKIVDEGNTMVIYPTKYDFEANKKLPKIS